MCPGLSIQAYHTHVEQKWTVTVFTRVSVAPKYKTHPSLCLVFPVLSYWVSLNWQEIHTQEQDAPLVWVLNFGTRRCVKYTSGHGGTTRSVGAGLQREVTRFFVDDWGGGGGAFLGYEEKWTTNEMFC